MEQSQPAVMEAKKGFSAAQVVGIVLAAMALTGVGMLLTIKFWLFPKPFTPVVLSAKEEQTLAHKLDRFETGLSESRDQTVKERSATGKNPPRYAGNPAGQAPATKAGAPEQVVPGKPLDPEAYSEEGASREIAFNEREVNAMLAKNTDLADKLAVDLASDLISIKLLLPMDPDFPMVGGKTLRVRAGAELAYRESRPVVILRGVSVMGVPVPNAWLGGLKNIDLVSEFGGSAGFWKTFADGVESISVREGAMLIKLKE